MKHYSKIIFKYVNTNVRPIFNIFFWIKWLWVPWTIYEQWLCPLKLKRVQEKKKREMTKHRCKISWIQTLPKYHILFWWNYDISTHLIFMELAILLRRRFRIIDKQDLSNKLVYLFYFLLFLRKIWFVQQIS